MDEHDLRNLASFVANARLLLELGNIHAAQTELDHAASIIPVELWPIDIPCPRSAA